MCNTIFEYIICNAGACARACQEGKKHTHTKGNTEKNWKVYQVQFRNIACPHSTQPVELNEAINLC